MTTASMTATGAGLHNVFVYGSLLADEVVNALLKRMPPCSPAILNGYHRYSIKGRVYPAILPVESKKVIGRVIKGVTDAELHVLDAFEDEEYKRSTVEVLDAFEDEEYKRSTVEVFLNDDSGELFAETYVWADKDDPKLYGEWDFEEWKELHLKDFLSMTEGFVKELEQLELKTRVATYEAYYKKL